jgi:hypothetical protein
LTPTDRPGCASAHSILYLRLREEPHLARALFDINKAGLVIVGIFVLIWGRVFSAVADRGGAPGVAGRRSGDGADCLVVIQVRHECRAAHRSGDVFGRLGRC